MAIIDTREQHDEYKAVLTKHKPSRRPIVVAGCTADKISLVSIFLQGLGVPR